MKNNKTYFLLMYLILSTFFSQAQSEYFMKVVGENLNGDSENTSHLNEFVLKSFNFGVLNEGNTHLSLTPAGQPEFTGFQIVLRQTKNMAKLYDHIHTGVKFDTITISLMKTFNSVLKDYLVFTLDDVHITGMNYEIDSNDDVINVSANLFADKVKIEHFVTNPNGTRQEPPYEAEWNIAQNSQY